jgi:hypothetical protein
MKRLFLVAAVCIGVISGFSQQITGTIIGEEITVIKGDAGIAVLKISPSKAVVYINNTRLDGIPESVKLNTGTYTIYVEADGYPSQSKTFVIEKNKTCTVEISLSNIEAVSIETNVTAYRKIDGIDYPEEKLASYELTFGRHTVECTAEGYKPLKKTIDVKAGRSNAHSFTLREVAPVPEPSDMGMRGKHEIGILVGGMYGLSHKYWFTDHLALQTDLAVGLTYFENIEYEERVYSYYDHRYVYDYCSFSSIFDFTLNPNVTYNFTLPRNFYIYAGGGVSLGYLSNIGYIDRWYGSDQRVHMGKFGINAMIGTEYVFANKPISLALDFRPGYGLAFRDSYYMPTCHYFDWKLAFSLRYIIK